MVFGLHFGLILVTFSRKNRCKNRPRVRTYKKSSSGSKKSTFGDAWSRKINEKPLGNIVFRENRFFSSGRRFFSLLGAKSAQKEGFWSPLWPQNGEKTASENEGGKRGGKSEDFFNNWGCLAECADLLGRNLKGQEGCDIRLSTGS